MHFEYWDSEKNNQWYWRLRAANGRIIAVGGEGFSSKQSCLDSIELVKQCANAPVEEVEE